MSKYIKIIRSNWKKSLLGCVAVYYGTNYGYETYQTKQMMRALCEEAAKYGEIPVPPTLKPRNVKVILNPAANRRKAKSNYEKYCAPLLHLAGYSVDVITTESEGQARALAADLKDTDIIVVAGGDGTLSETVTGMMRAHGAVSTPVGVLPLGRTNSVALALLGRGVRTGGEARDMAAAAMAVVRGQTKQIDAVRVDVIEDTEVENPHKSVYGLSGIKWGAYREALSRQDQYWYLGVLRGYAAVLFNSLSSHRQPVMAHVMYTHACDGCNRCYHSRTDLHETQSRRWFHYLVPSFTKKTQEAPKKNYKQVMNPNCGIVSELDLTALDINVTCPCVCGGSKGLQVSLGPRTLGWWEWVEEGWRRVSGEPEAISPLADAQQLEIKPVDKNNEEKWLSIDNEEYEVRPIKVTLIPKSVQVFFNEPVRTIFDNENEKIWPTAANPDVTGHQTPADKHKNQLQLRHMDDRMRAYTLLERAILGCC